MNEIDSVFDPINESVFRDVKSIVVNCLPLSIPELERTQIELAVTEAIHKKEIEFNHVFETASRTLDSRIRDFQGTQSDLRAMPRLGKLIKLLRGAQRPVWGYATMVLDFIWFLRLDKMTDRQEVTLLIINVLVLLCLFGERAIQNAGPVIAEIRRARVVSPIVVERRENKPNLGE